MRSAILNTATPIFMAAALLAEPAHASGRTSEPQLNASIYGGTGEVGSTDAYVYGARMSGVLSGGFLVATSYEQYDIDDVDADVKELRFGLGAIGTFGEKRRVRLYAQADYVDLKTPTNFGEDDFGGFGVILGLNARMPASLRLYSRIGYLGLENNLEGFEYLLGLAFEKPRGIWSLFSEYRGVRLDESGDSEIDFDTVRVGVGLSF